MIDATILSNLHRELNAHLTTIASTHGPATKAAHEKKRIADAAAAASGNPSKPTAAELRLQRIQARNEKKSPGGLGYYLR